jgi:hypothetical protein
MTDQAGITCRTCGKHWDTTPEVDQLLQEVEDHDRIHTQPDEALPRIYLR